MAEKSGEFSIEHSWHITDFTTQIIIIIGFLVGTILVIGFELMVTFLQALRLHIVEFFSKMHFSGTGRSFNPFRSNRVFTEPVTLTGSNPPKVKT